MAGSAMYLPPAALPIADATIYSDENHDCHQIAVFVLIDPSAVNVEASIATITQAVGTEDVASFMHGVHLADHSLRDILNYHLQSRKWYPNHHLTLFLVVRSPNIEIDGVLLVEANVDLEGRVEKVRLPVAEALSIAISLNIGNMSWDEVKEQDLEFALRPMPHCSTYRCHETQAAERAGMQADAR